MQPAHRNETLVLAAQSRVGDVVESLNRAFGKCPDDTWAEPAQGVERAMEWELPDGVHVLFEESNLFRCLRVVVTGQKGGVVRAAADDVRTVLDVTPATEILEAVQNADTPEERKNAILRAAAGPPDAFLAALHESVSTALRDPDHEVRVAARRFVEEVLWEEFLPVLDELIDGGDLPEGAGAVQILHEMITLATKHPDAE